MAARAPAIVAAEQDLVEHLQERGHPFARVADRKTFIDRGTNEMTVRLTVDAGRPASFGPLAFAGRQAVEEAYMRRIADWRSEEPTSEPQLLMRISSAVFWLKNKTIH